MFTGLIEGVGRLAGREMRGGDARLRGSVHCACNSNTGVSIQSNGHAKSRYASSIRRRSGGQYSRISARSGSIACSTPSGAIMSW